MRAKRLALLALLTLAVAVPSTSAQSHIRSAASSEPPPAPSAAASSASSSRANDSDAITTASLANTTTTTHRPIVSVWTADDVCGATTQRAGCVFEPTCSLCLTRPGCAIESTTGRCISVSRINPANVGVTYLESGKAEYCDATDTACAACRSGDSDALHYGSNGCVCMRQCELQSAAPLECLSVLSFTPTAYLVMAAAVFCTASIGYQVRRARRARALGTGRLVQRRRQRPAIEAHPHPLTLKLDNWKKDRSDHSEAFANIELKSCYIQMGDGDSCDDSRNGRGDSDSQRETVLGNGSFCSDLDGFDDDVVQQQHRDP